MPSLDEMIAEINRRSEGGALFLCIHMEPHLILGPFAKTQRFIAEAFLKHLQDKWPDLEAHIVEGGGIGRQERN